MTVHLILPEADLRLLMRQDAQAAAEALIGAVEALGLPEQDNATVAILGIEPEAVADPSPPTPDTPPTGRRRPWGLIALAIGVVLLVLIVAYLQFGSDPNPGRAVLSLGQERVQSEAANPPRPGAIGIKSPISSRRSKLA